MTAPAEHEEWPGRSEPHPWEGNPPSNPHCMHVVADIRQPMGYGFCGHPKDHPLHEEAP